MKVEYSREKTAVFVLIASSYMLCGHSIQSELDFSPVCLIGSAEMILLVCVLWVTGQEELSLLFEMYWATVSWNMSTQKLGLVVMKSAR